MPGLLNCFTGAALPLTASDVTSYVSGYALGLTASLTYGNLEAQPFQGKNLCGFPVQFFSTLSPRPMLYYLADTGRVRDLSVSASIYLYIYRVAFPGLPHRCESEGGMEARRTEI